MQELNKIMDFQQLSKYPDFTRAGIEIDDEGPSTLRQQLFNKGYVCKDAYKQPSEQHMPIYYVGDSNRYKIHQ